MKNTQVRDTLFGTAWSQATLQITSGSPLVLPHRDMFICPEGSDTLVALIEGRIHIVWLDEISSITLDRIKKAKTPVK